MKTPGMPLTARQAEFVKMLDAGITLGQAVARTGYAENFIKKMLREHEDWPRLKPAISQDVRHFSAAGDVHFKSIPSDLHRRKVSLKAEPWHGK